MGRCAIMRVRKGAASSRVRSFIPRRPRSPIGWAADERFQRSPGGLAGAGPERRLPPALLLSFEPLAVAGSGESRLPRTRRCRGALRPGGALALVRDEAAVGHLTPRVRASGS